MQTVLKLIEDLGRQIEAEYQSVNADQRMLSGIAESVLGKFSELDGIEISSLAEFLKDTRVPQQAQNPFSDLPVNLFISRDFYIELLVWSNATTAIHQHSFSGAFRVVRGSSIHTRYAFEEQARVNDDCLVGDVMTLESELLSVGSVRKIEPGSSGLIHSLYHLDNPSLSLVVRTRGHSAFGSQFSFYPPSLALNRKALESDEMVLMFSRLLAVSQTTDKKLFSSIWLDYIPKMEFPRLAWTFLAHHGHLDDEQRCEFFERVEMTHGELALKLFGAIERHEKKRILIELRAQVYDPELRFFVALLLNVPDRNDLLRMVSERFPDRDPTECCAEWLLQMVVDEKSELQRMKEIARVMETSERQAISFGRQLRRALPRGAGPGLASEIFRKFIEKTASPSFYKSANFSLCEHEGALHALEQIPQLSALCSND